MSFGAYGDGDYWIREDHWLQSYRVVGVTQGVTGLNVLHTYNSEGCHLPELRIQLGTVISVHLYHAADTLGFAGVGVEDGHTLFHYDQSRYG